MPRDTNSPLLINRVLDIPVRNARSRTYLVLASLGCLVLLGLLLLGKPAMGAEPMAEFQHFLVHGDYKINKLSQYQLDELVGMYYAKAPKASELKALYDSGQKRTTASEYSHYSTGFDGYNGKMSAISVVNDGNDGVNKVPLMLLIGAIVLIFPLLSALPVNPSRFLVKCGVKNNRDTAFIFEMMDKDGLDVWDHELPVTPATVTILATKEQLEKLKRGLKCQKAIDIGLIEKQSQQFDRADPGPDHDFFANYRSYLQIESKLRTYQNTRLEIKVEVIASSHERRNISVIRMASKEERPGEKLWFSCGQHAREWIAPASCMYLVDQLVARFGTDERITSLLKQFEVLVVPLVNPDGYEYSRNFDRYWRKNRRKNGFAQKFGVDLNRNWPNRWGFIGVSSNPSSDVYMGPSAGSEPEVSQVGKYIMSLERLVAGVDVHSYGELILRSYGWTAKPSPDEARLRPMSDTIADTMSGINGEYYRSQRSGELYPAAGAMDDWIYEQAKAIGMTFEMRDNGSYGFLLPASQIVPTGQELLAAVLILADKVRA